MYILSCQPSTATYSETYPPSSLPPMLCSLTLRALSRTDYWLDRILEKRWKGIVANGDPGKRPNNYASTPHFETCNLGKRETRNEKEKDKSKNGKSGTSERGATLTPDFCFSFEFFRFSVVDDQPRRFCEVSTLFVYLLGTNHKDSRGLEVGVVDTVVRSHGRWVANSFLNYRRDAIAKKVIDLELDFSSSIFQADHPNRDEDIVDEWNPHPNPRQVQYQYSTGKPAFLA